MKYYIHTVRPCFTTYQVEAKDAKEAREKFENDKAEEIGEEFGENQEVEIIKA